MIMQRTYIVFLVILLVFIGFNFYMIDWQTGFLEPINHSYLLSACFGLIGVLVVLVLNFLSKLKSKN